MKPKLSKPTPRVPLRLPRTDLPAWDLPEPKPCPPDPLWKDILATAFFSLTGGAVAAFVAAAALARGSRGTVNWTDGVWMPAGVFGLIVAAGLAVFIWRDGGYPKPSVEDEYSYDWDRFDDHGPQ